MTAPPPTATKAERNALIIAALAEHGTLAGAARKAGCDPRTVGRLCKADPAAAEALTLGVRARHRRRIVKYEGRLEAAQAWLAQIERAIAGTTQTLTDDYASLTLSEVKRLDHDLTRLHNDRGKAQTRVRVAERALDYARKRAAEQGGDDDEEQA